MLKSSLTVPLITCAEGALQFSVGGVKPPLPAVPVEGSKLM